MSDEQTPRPQPAPCPCCSGRKYLIGDNFLCVACPWCQGKGTIQVSSEGTDTPPERTSKMNMRPVEKGRFLRQLDATIAQWTQCKFADQNTHRERADTLIELRRFVDLEFLTEIACSAAMNEDAVRKSWPPGLGVAVSDAVKRAIRGQY